MIVTYEDNGVSKIMNHEFPRPFINKDFEKEIRMNLHKHSVREQMVIEFKKLCGENPSDNTIGWALEEIKEKRIYSKIDRIEFHYGKDLSNFNVKYSYEKN